MAFTVSESTEGHQHSDGACSRNYVVEWDGAGTSTTALARNAVLNYLYTQVEDISDGSIRTLGGMESPTATEIRLRYRLHNMPIQGVTADEVRDSEGAYYIARARWAYRDQEQQGDLTVGVAAGLNANAAFNVSYALNGRVEGSEIDYAPLIGVLRRDVRGSLSDVDAVPPFPLGALNCVRDKIGEEIDVRGLRYSSPRVKFTVSIEMTGAPPDAALIKTWDDAANSGTLNTDTVTLGGITYLPYELCFCDFRVTAQRGATVEIDEGDVETATTANNRLLLGFSTGQRKTLTVVDTDAGDVTAGENLATKKSDVSEFIHTDSSVEFYWHSPAAPSSPVVIGPHDYVWRFVDHEIENGVLTSEVKHLSIHRIFPSAAYGTLFGATTL